ncbi:N-acetylmuramoyl-L-alanine amidase CwlD [Amedibacterium intestinale]|uniref:N-acetylmuramoyl-L-alanine amidase CwlD n=1 Tax=Amedibacterium intestinale TaxID=2583452 RepID=A0A6N4THS0_9FIRM|nr:N-acetylmuramoyl-L-alanine amidase [Amedibacterium intestinale]BBK21975.1 N-acetylmuramoyl-L-alanine amidase CwlD [Amedibacterium intestinale]
MKEEVSVYEDTVVLDAGDGAMYAGSRSENQVYEKHMNLSITKMIGGGDYLTKREIHVVYTREDDNITFTSQVKDLKRRIKVAERADADYFISIHMNSSKYNDGASGFEIYTDNRNKDIAALVKKIESSLTSLNYTKNRGIKNTRESGQLYVIDNNPVPSMLIDAGFISDPNDFTYLNSRKGQKEVSEAIGFGLLQHLEDKNNKS